MPKVVHCKREAYDVLIDRTTKWGNPFVLGVHGNRKKVIQLHREWLPTQHHLVAQLHELKGQNLGCWCKPDACHGDFLLELANDE